MSTRLRELAAALTVGLLLLGATNALYAQDATATDTAQTQEETAPGSDAQSDAQSDQSDSDAPELAQTGDDDSGGSRFIPTEQLSQDLGASFPVDI